jgi:hypothetical protein
MDSIAGGSPRRLARLAGARYLVDILGGAFAITVVPVMLVAQDNLAATAQNIHTHELLYRSGLTARVVVTTTNVPLAVILYELFKVVNRRLALLDACFIMVATASCDQARLRLVRGPGRAWLDLRGLTYLQLPVPDGT